MTATDPDPGDVITYSLDPVNNGGGKFTVGPSNGVVGLLSDLGSGRYQVIVRATDSRGRQAAVTVRTYADKTPLNIFGEMGVLHFIRPEDEPFKLEWVIPAGQRESGYTYRLKVERGTGLQINSPTASNPTECNWRNLPSEYTPWSSPDAEFYLVRCEVGTGNDHIYLERRDTQNRVLSASHDLGTIRESWHRNDHRVGYQLAKAMPARPSNYAHANNMNWAEFGKGVEAAVSAWNYVQAAVAFDRVTKSPDTLIEGYWNKTGGGSHNDPCKTSVACTYAGTSTYPHLGNNQPFYVEFPPQFPGDNQPRQWTNNWYNASMVSAGYYYLPQLMMHELGHTTGLGHSHRDNAYSVMGGC